MKAKWRMTANVALALASCLVGLALVEASLRVFLPKYEHLVTARFIRDPALGYVREPNRRDSLPHPDTGEPHPFHHNNFGFRQHRDFSPADLESAVNIGFFGDSFTENGGMAARFSFTEPLDYLLNADAAGSDQRGFNVLNFGVWGYGTHQSVLRYETWESRGTLDHVFYIYYRNDLWETQAFALDDAGQFKWDDRSNPYAMLGKLHLSYLAVDVAFRLSTHLAESGFGQRLAEGDWRKQPNRGAWANLAQAARQGAPDPYTLFRQLLRRFKAAVEGDGASFRLVRLPDIPCGAMCRSVATASPQLARLPDDPGFGVATIVAEEGVEVVDLQKCFARFDPAHPHTPWWQSPYRFKRDAHWNEAGNRLAALCLHRDLKPRLGLGRFSEDEAAAALDRYYAAFEAPALQGIADPTANAIRAKYDALRGTPPDRLNPLPPWTPSPDKLVIRSRFNVYLHDRWLAYVRQGCQLSDFHERFFLHLVPRDLRDLSAERLPSGFANLDFDWSETRPQDFHWEYDRPLFQMATCTIYRRLPRYAIERIRTGQFAAEGGVHERLWEGEHVLAAGRPPTHMPLAETASDEA